MIVLVHGTFDPFHYGHLLLFRYARSLAGVHGEVIVTVTADMFVKKEGRPICNETERKEIIEALSIVTKVDISHHATGLPMIARYAPDIYLKGPDYKDSSDKHFHLERQAVEKFGGRLLVASQLPKYSSSYLIDRIRNETGKTSAPD